VVECASGVHNVVRTEPYTKIDRSPCQLEGGMLLRVPGGDHGEENVDILTSPDGI
jgi:hypothetical protein